MNAHVEFNEVGRYLPWPKELRILRRNLLWIGGCTAVVAGALLALLGSDASPTSALGAAHVMVPLGIVIATLGTILLVAFAGGSASRRRATEHVATGSAAAESAPNGPGNAAKRRSMSRELRLLAELHESGVLSLAEFKKAKKRVLNG